MKLLVLVSVLLIAAVGTAQNYSVDWYKISGGGGSCSGGTYTLTSTIGQHDATVMTGGRYSLVGGFWAIITAVQT
ncbi:MAG TPA: hypothetical protein VKY92_19515, partial [Verrucomicrobiae bacterium]|nr:hypothetical protein [Verrucomicrobiae bacterium]